MIEECEKYTVDKPQYEFYKALLEWCDLTGAKVNDFETLLYMVCNSLGYKSYDSTEPPTINTLRDRILDLLTRSA